MSVVAEARPQIQLTVIQNPETPMSEVKADLPSAEPTEATATVSAITANSPSKGDLPCVGCTAGSCAKCPFADQVKVKWETIIDIPDSLDSLNKKPQKPMLTLRRVDTAPVELQKPKKVIPLLRVAEPTIPESFEEPQTNTQPIDLSAQLQSSQPTEQYTQTPIISSHAIEPAPTQPLAVNGARDTKPTLPIVDNPVHTMPLQISMQNDTPRPRIEQFPAPLAPDTPLPIAPENEPEQVMRDETLSAQQPSLVDAKRQRDYEERYDMPAFSGINEEPKVPAPMTKIIQAENPKPQDTRTAQEPKQVTSSISVTVARDKPVQIMEGDIGIAPNPQQNEVALQDRAESQIQPTFETVRPASKDAAPQPLPSADIDITQRLQEQTMPTDQTTITDTAAFPLEVKKQSLPEKLLEAPVIETGFDENVMMPDPDVSEVTTDVANSEKPEETTYETYETYDTALKTTMTTEKARAKDIDGEQISADAVDVMKELIQQEERLYEELAPTKILKINDRILVAKVQEDQSPEQSDQEVVDDASELRTTKELAMVLSVAVEEKQEGQELQNEKNAVIIKISDQVAENLQLVRTIVSNEITALNQDKDVDKKAKEPIILVAKNNFIVMERNEASRLLSIYVKAADEVRREKTGQIELHNIELPLQKATDTFSFETEHQHMDIGEDVPEYVAIPLETPRPTAEVKKLTNITEVVNAMQALIAMTQEVGDIPSYANEELEIPISDDLLSTIDALYMETSVENVVIPRNTLGSTYIFSSDSRELRLHISELDSLLERIKMEQLAIDSFLRDLGLPMPMRSLHRNKKNHRKARPIISPATSLSIWQSLLLQAA